MQQRFCMCGCAVWVDYQFHNMDCRIIFRSDSNDTKDCLTRCPYCGKQLVIDELYLYQPYLLHSKQIELRENG